MANKRLCSVIGCTNAHHTMTNVNGVLIGLCASHRSRITRSGNIGTTPLRTCAMRPAGVRHCQVTGCLKPLKPGHVQTDNGPVWVCSMHTSRWKKYETFADRYGNN